MVRSGKLVHSRYIDFLLCGVVIVLQSFLDKKYFMRYHYFNAIPCDDWLLHWAWVLAGSVVPFGCWKLGLDQVPYDESSISTWDAHQLKSTHFVSTVELSWMVLYLIFWALQHSDQTSICRIVLHSIILIIMPQQVLKVTDNGTICMLAPLAPGGDKCSSCLLLSIRNGNRSCTLMKLSQCSYVRRHSVLPLHGCCEMSCIPKMKGGPPYRNLCMKLIIIIIIIGSYARITTWTMSAQMLLALLQEFENGVDVFLSTAPI